jgi:hypothetical protein
MERYFREPKQTAEADKDPLRRSQMVLKDELWRGQEHGSVPETIVHSRYLRCLCEKFSTGKTIPWTLTPQC